MAALRATVAFQPAITAQQGGRAQRRVVVAASAAPDSGGAAAAPPPLSRRQLQAAALAAVLAMQAPAAQAIGFQKELKKKKIAAEDYTELPNEPRLRIYDLAPGSGAEVKPGTRVKVHFDVMYRGIDVVSTRTARTLGGNRTVAEPFEFIANEPLSGEGSYARQVENAGGLFTGGGPKPPLALSSAVVGMRVGGKRSVLVPAELGYGSKGEQEIPPNCDSFDLRIEVLSMA